MGAYKCDLKVILLFKYCTQHPTVKRSLCLEMTLPRPELLFDVFLAACRPVAEEKTNVRVWCILGRFPVRPRLSRIEHKFAARQICHFGKFTVSLVTYKGGLHLGWRNDEAVEV